MSAPSSMRVHPHSTCVNPLFPFFLLQRLFSMSGKPARGSSERQRLLKALPLATDKTAEDPPDPLSKKLARNFSRSAQLLSELIKGTIDTVRIARNISTKMTFPFSIFTAEKMKDFFQMYAFSECFSKQPFFVYLKYLPSTCSKI